MNANIIGLKSTRANQRQSTYVWLFILAFILCQRALGAELPTFTVAERGPHHAVWERVTQHTTSYGRTYYVTNSYQELATGKHYLKDGQWLPSVPEITILANGFGVATQLQHKVIFAPNINTLGAIDCLTPDDKRLRSHVLGLAYTDTRTGKGVMIAEVKDSIGVLVANNQVLYPDAFDSEGGFRADVRYTVSLAGIEQDIILVQSPPDPAIYGIDPANCRLEVYSEFVEFPEPVRQTVVLGREADAQMRKGMAEPDLIEEKLIFGVMRMGQGSAFRFDHNDTSIPMGKTWEQREGRQLLIERADYSDIREELGSLPRAAQLQDPKKPVLMKGADQVAWASFLPARPPGAQAALWRLRTKEVAQVSLPQAGFVLDYQLVTAQTNFTFRGDTTYYVSSDVTLAETTTFEAGTVIKYAPTNSSRVRLNGPLDCQTSSSRPAYLIARDDDTVGEPIAGSTGAPGTNYYGSSRSLELNSSGTAYSLHDLRFRNLNRHLATTAASTVELTHSQMSQGDIAIYRFGGAGIPIALRNVLMVNMVTAFSGATNRSVENCTFHGIDTFSSPSSVTVYATNCLLAAVTNNVWLTGINNETNINDSGIFQTAGYGQRYLASNSPYRNTGTTNINTNLLADLRQLTTYPPVVISKHITNDTALVPQAQRDTDTPDLGYHYLPCDWLLMGGIGISTATVSIRYGATIGIDAAPTNLTPGLRLDMSGHLVSEGMPDNLNRFVRTYSFQEVPAGTTNSPMFGDTYPATGYGTSIRLRFTDISQIQRQCAFLQENNRGTFDSIVIYDSQFRGGSNYLSQSSSNQFVGITNCLFQQSSLRFYPYPPVVMRICDSTFKGGWLGVSAPVGTDCKVLNNVFDYTAFGMGGAFTLTNDYNGYLTNSARLTPNGANDVVLATNTVNFQAGPLGAYYLPTNSLFVNAGSVTNAGFVGLWHYTTRTDQTKDGATRLDLGFHYVALNGSNQPIDSDSDGIPDYLEDANGDGDLDSGETNYNDPNDLGLKVLITRPRNGSVIP